MNINLELILIESGYDTKNARPISPAEASKLISEKIYPKTHGEPKGAVLFDDGASLAVRLLPETSNARLSDTTYHATTIIHGKPAIVVTSGDGGDGLFLYHPLDSESGQRASVYFRGRGSILPLELSTTGLAVKVLSDTGNEIGQVEISPSKSTNIYRLTSIGEAAKNDLFWETVIGHLGLLSRKGENGAYSAADNESSIFFDLKSRENYHQITVRFPEERSASDLRSLVDGLLIEPQTVGNKWVGNNIDISGREFIVRIQRRYSQEVVSYIGRVINQPSPKA